MVSFVSLACIFAVSDPAVADLDAEQQIRELKEEVELIEQETERSIRELHRQIDALSTESAPSSEDEDEDEADNNETATDRNRFRVFGDFRLRYEHNSASAAAPSGDRGVLRGRIGATYSVSDYLTAGARLVTGDATNPRTADVTLSDFAGDLEVSLDQAYLAYNGDSVAITGGKFPKPFVSTELVWDGDVNPQGFGASVDLVRGTNLQLEASAIYFVLDENQAAGRSHMTGGQLSTSFITGDDWHLGLHGAYYNYDIRTLAPVASSRARGNNLIPDGQTLLSDFDLLDLVGSVTYTGLGEQWNLRLVGNYVRNLGAAVPEDEGFGFDVYAGNLDNPGRWQFRYGYAQAETDAVLGLYSHDNLPYATNYDMHTLSVGYAVQSHTFVELATYRYRQHDPGPDLPLGGDWSSRTRLNLFVNF